MTVFFSVTANAPSLPAPSGTVTVQASSGERCTGAAQSGSCQITFAAAGDRTITATYAGDPYFEPSTSPAGSLRIVNFRLSVTPPAQTINGKKATYILTLVSENGFTGSVSLTCAGGPPNATCSVSPASVTLSGASVTAKAVVTVPNGAQNGTYDVTFNASSGGASRSATAKLTVGAPSPVNR